MSKYFIYSYILGLENLFPRGFFSYLLLESFGKLIDVHFISKISRLFTRHVLSANSSLISCIKSTRVNFSRNPSESFKIYFICKIVSN